MVAFSKRLSAAMVLLSLLSISCESKSANSGQVAPLGEPTATIDTVNYDALYVVNGGSNTLSVLDAGTGALKGTVKLADVEYPHHISLNPNKSMLMISAPGMDLSAGHGSGHGSDSSEMTGSLLMLDALTGAEMKRRKLDGMAHNAIFSPDGSEVWAALMAMAGKVIVMDSATLQTKQTISVGDMPAEVTFSKDGKNAFVANGMSNSISVIGVESKAVIKTISVGKNPVGAWTGNDGVMYVDNEEGRSISAIDTTSLAVVRTYDLGFTPGMAATSSDGDLWVTDADSGKVSYFMAGMAMKMGDIATGPGTHGITFSADGKFAYVSNESAGTITIIEVASHKVKSTVNVGTKPNGVLFRAK